MQMIRESFILENSSPIRLSVYGFHQDISVGALSFRAEEGIFHDGHYVCCGCHTACTNIQILFRIGQLVRSAIMSAEHPFVPVQSLERD